MKLSTFVLLAVQALQYRRQHFSVAECVDRAGEALLTWKIEQRVGAVQGGAWTLFQR